MDRDGWVKWNGKGPTPVFVVGTKLQLRLRDGTVTSEGVFDVSWHHNSGAHDVVEYRVVEEPKGASESTKNAWIERDTNGHFPVIKPVMVEVRYRDGRTETGPAAQFDWYDAARNACITAFRYVTNATADTALAVQVGGSHYKGLAIQPVEFVHRNGIGFCEGNAIKYLTRWRDKGGVEDLKKAKHYIDLLIEMETKQ